MDAFAIIGLEQLPLFCHLVSHYRYARRNNTRKAKEHIIFYLFCIQSINSAAAAHINATVDGGFYGDDILIVLFLISTRKGPSKQSGRYYQFSEVGGKVIIAFHIFLYLPASRFQFFRLCFALDQHTKLCPTKKLHILCKDKEKQNILK